MPDRTSSADARKIIDIVFTPAAEILNPLLFSGRVDDIDKGMKALRSYGASLCIYGGTGVGKSSIARQLMLIGAGSVELPSILNKMDLFSTDTFKMPIVNFRCDSSICNSESLFQKLLSDRDSFEGICRYNHGVILQRIKERNSKSSKLTLKFIERSSSTELESENVKPEIDYVAAFKAVTSEIVDASDSNAIIVVLDNFELVAGHIGIGTIIKSTPHVKFIIVGVAENYLSLISDYESVSRQLDEGLMKIGLMDTEMLAGIIRRVERAFNQENIELCFSKDIIASITNSSRGYPFWIHRIGKECCHLALDQGKNTIDQECFNEAITSIVKDNVRFEDLYRNIVKSSWKHEALLKALAYDISEEHTLEDIYCILESNLDISHANSAMILRKFIDNEILRETRRGFCTFSDPMFKGFVSIRPPLFKTNSEASLTFVRRMNVPPIVHGAWKEVPYLPTNMTYQALMGTYAEVEQLSGVSWAVHPNTDFMVESENQKPIIILGYDGKPIRK